jgi:hypothetical protein
MKEEHHLSVLMSDRHSKMREGSRNPRYRSFQQRNAPVKIAPKYKEFPRTADGVSY